VIVFRGEPTLRTPEGEQVSKEGDVVCFPRGKEGAQCSGMTPERVPRSCELRQAERTDSVTRQSVHSTVNRLAADGIVQLADNADHRRPQLVSLTELGQAKYRALDEKQADRVNELVAGLNLVASVFGNVPEKQRVALGGCSWRPH
jgi:hypothetical protein